MQEIPIIYSVKEDYGIFEICQICFLIQVGEVLQGKELEPFLQVFFNIPGPRCRP